MGLWRQGLAHLHQTEPFRKGHRNPIVQAKLLEGSAAEGASAWIVSTKKHSAAPAPTAQFVRNNSLAFQRRTRRTSIQSGMKTIHTNLTAARIDTLVMRALANGLYQDETHGSQICVISMVFGADGFGSMRNRRVRFLPRIKSS